MKPLRAFGAGMALTLALTATAQNKGTLADLWVYASQLGTRLNASNAEIAAQKAQLNAVTTYLRDWTCKWNNEQAVLQALAKAAGPVDVTLTTGKDCAGTGPAPELPDDLK